MAVPAPKIVLCNGAAPARGDGGTPLRLDYRRGTSPTVRIKLPDFVRAVYHLPPRILDLLELAAYVYCADRFTSRGRKNALEFHRWSRRFHFRMKIRDVEFWTDRNVGEQLNETLSFLSGDREFAFTFEGGHQTPPTDLFDEAQFTVGGRENTKVQLFSGGLDSLAGVMELLKDTTVDVCLVSHRSGQPGTKRTQDQLFKALAADFPGRLQHYRFECGLTEIRATEETQRTRMFLYSSIAAALCTAVSANELFIFENGITSLNLPRRQDLMNGRATRTTHPKTVALLQRLFSLVLDESFAIRVPFFWETKTDVILRLANSGSERLLSSAVSCSKTFSDIGPSSHCGGCSQCIDRRMAAYGARVEEIDDAGLYSFDFITKRIDDNEVRTTLVDYIRQARNFARWNPDHFHDQLLTELALVVDHIGEKTPEDGIWHLWQLCQRHGAQVMQALARMREKHDQLSETIPDGSLLKICADREYLKPPVERLVKQICERIQRSIPLIFQKNRPKNEPDLNDKISGVLNVERPAFEREHPAIRFALGSVVADHATEEHELLIETKYIRKGTTPSRASEGIAADLIKYPPSAHVLFLVYDPDRAVADDMKFRRDFEARRVCTVFVFR